MKPNGVRAVLFDLDGTFADTAPDLARALNRVRAERGLAPLPPEVARPWTSSGARGLLKVGFGVTPESPDYGALRESFLDWYGRELCVETRLFDGIPEVIAKMRAHKLPWGIVTNKGKRFTDPLLRVWVRLHCRPSAPTEDDIAREVHRYALPRMPQQSEPVAAPHSEPAFAMAGGPPASGIIEID